MFIDPENLYHIYNRGNNKSRLFFQERNYDFFLKKVVNHFSRHVDLLAYCLMPNHFHFMIYAKETIDSNKFSGSLRTLLSSYTRAIQNQEKRTGSLFQQNTKAAEIYGYAENCFHYIHQNPLKAGIVKKIEDWRYSSFNEYWKGEKGICNIELAHTLLNLEGNPDKFYAQSCHHLSGGTTSFLRP